MSRFLEFTSNYQSSVLAYRQFMEYVVASLRNTEGVEAGSDLVSAAVERLEAVASERDREQARRMASFLIAFADGPKADAGRDSATEKPKKRRITLRMTSRATAALMSLVTAVRWYVPPSEHEELLYRGILIGLVSQFEVLIGNIAAEFFRRAPGALDSREKVLSLGEIRQFATTADIEEYLISRRVDDLLRGSLDDWSEFLLRRMNIQLKEFPARLASFC